MDEKLVYVKAAKGVAEVATRGGALSLSARRILIMIDGKRTIAELAPLLRPGEIDTVVATLESQGFIQRGTNFDVPTRSLPRTLEPATGGPLEVNTVDGTAPEERTLLTMDEAKRRAVRELNDRLGPDGETMAVRLEHCRTADELRERLREAERLIAGLLGESAAQDYVRALRRR
jgi:hypothetical protein